MNISVIIPTYKNKEQLLNNLKHNLKFIKDLEIIVINDDPNESIKTDIQSFKEIELIENNFNIGFGASINLAAKQAKNDYLMLLNNDVTLDNNSYRLGLKHFEKDNNLFAIAFAQHEKKDQIGKNIIYWLNGFIHHDKASNLNYGINAWAEGGACLINKKYFLELEGFDELFSPFYWEDIDLSYRAWKSGLKILFDPNISVTHDHQNINSSIRSNYTNDYIQTISYRNQFIFIWKNINDQNLIRQHIINLSRTLFLSLVKGNILLIKGFFWALKMLPSILKKRGEEKKNTKLSDINILQYFK